ncbi:MAG: HTTM domain-containing protein [Bdellovibrio sp.]|jgi:hypothetical protein
MSLQSITFLTGLLLIWSLLLQALEERWFFKKLNPLLQPWSSSSFLQIEGLILMAAGLCLMDLHESAPYLLFFGALSLLLDRLRLRWKLKGPLSGGSDQVTLLTLTCFTLATGVLAFEIDERIAKVAMAYLGLQTLLSYVLAGFAKLKSQDWRQGRVLQEILFHSQYPVPRKLRMKTRPKNLGALQLLSWLVLFFELSFVLVLFDFRLLAIWMPLAFIFHLLNTYLFGLHRFTWSWLAAYPALFYFASLI